MSGIGYPKGSPQYAAEASIGKGAEPRTPPVAQDGYKWDGGTLTIPPTPAPGGMTVSQLIDSRTPPRSQASRDHEDLGYRAMMAASRESVLMGQVRELERAIARAALPQADPVPIDPPPSYDWFDPRNPVNCVDPQHPIDSGAAVAFGMPGHLGTPLQEVSFLQNAIGRENYPLSVGPVYENTSRPLTEIEVSWLNEKAGVTP